MKVIIYFFSGTGNNLNIAKVLAETFEKKQIETDIKPIKDLLNSKTINKSYSHIIFCIPSYYSHIPPFVRECLNNLQFSEEQKVYTILGCAGNRGRAIEDMRECVQECRKNVSGEFMIINAPGYIISYGAFPKVYVKIVNYIASCITRKIAKKIINNKTSLKKNTGLFYRKSSEEKLQSCINKYGYIGINYTVLEKCKGCGICEKICPVNNIHIENRKPVFGDKCQQCMACIQWCPSKAIDYNGLIRDRKRYHNENITLNDMIQDR